MSKCLLYCQEIRGFKPDNATANHGQESDRTQLVLLSGSEALHLLRKFTKCNEHQQEAVQPSQIRKIIHISTFIKMCISAH